MNPETANAATPPPPAPGTPRLDSLDATRAFALLLGIVFHASLSFMPVFLGWAVQDVSTSPLVTGFTTISHSFRMELFFLLAGLFSQRAVGRAGTGAFLRSRILRIGVPFVVGWLLLRPLVVSGWILGSMSLRGSVDIPAALLGAAGSLATLPAGIFTGTHLWFLYYLALVTVLALGARGLLLAGGPALRAGVSRRADAFVAWLSNTPGSILLLAAPTAVLLGFMNSWGVDTPDRTLRPHLPVLLLYGGCFTLGWMLGRRQDRIAEFARLTPMRGVLACAGIAAVLSWGDLERDPGHPHHAAAHIGFALGYALTLWTLLFLTLGLFQRLCSRPNAAIRYVADSSYWMYLIHLPIVVWLQVAVAEWSLHWSLKLALISTATVGISLLTYDLWVRPTWMGSLLNGRLRERVLLPWLAGRLRGPGRAGKWRPSAATLR